MNSLTLFSNKEFGNIRVSTTSGEPLFCLTDVCRILEIENNRNVKNRLNKDGVVTMDTIDTMGRQE